jgi:3-dehydroshikimate dehydratase
MVTLTGFADEISSELTTQLNVLESAGIKHIELRRVWNKNVLKLDDAELHKVKIEMEQREFRLSAIGSPIGKIAITNDFEPHLQEFERAIEVARLFDVKYIRIFSFFYPKGEDPVQYRDEVIRRMKVLVKRAEEVGVILLHENEKEIYGDTPERCLDLLETCASPNFRCAFDPANFVQIGLNPYTQALPILKNHIAYVHIKDALLETGKEVPVGHGDGHVSEILQNLFNEGYNGYLSLEPHLNTSGKFSGHTGPDLFNGAIVALKDILKHLNKEWN